MGTLYYGAQRVPVEVEDRLLAHLKAVILVKLRRQESFALNIRESADAGSGRHTLWIHPALDLHFQFLGSRPPALDRELLSDLEQQASSARGIDLEDGASVAAGRSRY